jgi:hypothetical protein
LSADKSPDSREKRSWALGKKVLSWGLPLDGVATQEQGPYERPRRSRTMTPVSMYVDILSSAIASSGVQLTIDELVDRAILLRETVDDPCFYRQCAADVLAAEIAYDRVLIRLCELFGIAVNPAAFIHAHKARLGLEADLANMGVDLFTK